MRTVFAILSMALVTGLSINAARSEDSARLDESASYDLKVSPTEARDTLNGILAEIAQREARGEKIDPEFRKYIARLVRSYRSSEEFAGLPLKDAPYPHLILKEKLGEIYKAAYESEWKKEYERIVIGMPLDVLFDGLLQMVVDKTLPPEMAEVGEQIGECIAKKSIDGKSDECPLDLSEKVEESSIFSQAGAALSCALPFAISSDCNVRQVVFNAAKPKLLEARQKPEIQEALKKQFYKLYPVAFDKQLLAEINKRMLEFHELIAKKFQGSVDRVWSPATPLIEGEDTTSGRRTLHEFAGGLRADINAASILARSDNEEERGLAAGLFYAASNRLLVLMGGKKAQWDGKRFVTLELESSEVPTDLPSPLPSIAPPLPPPNLVAEDFGGWGAERGSSGIVVSAWDFGKYQPGTSQTSSPFRVFPSVVFLGPSGVPALPTEDSEPEETLADMAELLLACADYLKATSPNGPMASHFGDEKNLAALIDPESPILFPQEGRKLAIGVIATVLKNFLAPGLGHIELTGPGAGKQSGGGLGVVFHDVVKLSGRDSGPAPVLSVSQSLIAGAELRKALSNDPATPPELLAQLPQLDQALAIGALTIAGKGQAPDGGFYGRLGEPKASSRSLKTAVAAMTAMTKAYDASQMLVLRLSLKLGWVFLEKFWGSSVYPQTLEAPAAAASADPSELWNLLQLWNESQKFVRPDLASEIDWVKWDQRFDLLRAKLVDQLNSEQGPEPVGTGF